MREQEERLAALKVNTLVITFEAGFLAEQYIRETGLQWPLLVDENREAYRSYGMLNASFWDIWGPKTLWVYLKEALRGNLPKKSAGDISQRGGDVLIDPEGIVRLHHVGNGPAERPAVKTILRHLPVKVG